MEPIAELVFNMIAIMAFYQVRFANSEENLNDKVSKIKSEKNLLIQIKKIHLQVKLVYKKKQK